MVQYWSLVACASCDNASYFQVLDHAVLGLGTAGVPNGTERNGVKFNVRLRLRKPDSEKCVFANLLKMGWIMAGCLQ